jgi:hypothetical protein
MDSINAEFDRQKSNLIRLGYADFAQMKPELFANQVERLREGLHTLPFPSDGNEHIGIPFVIVVKSDLVPAEVAMPLVEFKGSAGSVNMHPVGPTSFRPIPQVQVPCQPMYLVFDIDTGRNSLNVTPADALTSILEKKRSPLVIDEGVALAVQFPVVLQDKERFNAFSILGSRRGDQRVPAIWVSSGKPRLGWCWEKNPHTWLGSASCGSRVSSAESAV